MGPRLQAAEAYRILEVSGGIFILWKFG